MYTSYSFILFFDLFCCLYVEFCIFLIGEQNFSRGSMPGVYSVAVVGQVNLAHQPPSVSQVLRKLNHKLYIFLLSWLLPLYYKVWPFIKTILFHCKYLYLIMLLDSWLESSVMCLIIILHCFMRHMMWDCLMMVLSVPLINFSVFSSIASTFHSVIHPHSKFWFFLCTLCSGNFLCECFCWTFYNFLQWCLCGHWNWKEDLHMNILSSQHHWKYS